MRQTLRRLTAPAALALACAALGAAAPAALSADGVVPGVSVAGVRLDARPPAVRALLGPPTSVRRLPPNELVPVPTYLWRYPGRDVRIIAGRVGSLSTTLPADVLVRSTAATPEPGAPGVGSTPAAVRRWAQAGGLLSECIPGFCDIQTRIEVGTILRVRKGRVAEITVGRLFD